MSLTNEQYDRIMRDYEELRRSARRERERRYQEVLERLPAYRALEEETGRAVSSFAADLMNDRQAPAEARARLDQARERKRLLLAEAGFPDDYLEPIVQCPLCRDTGFVDGKKCRCFQRREVALLYDHSHLDALSGISFPALREDVYGSDAEGLRSFRAARDAALAFARDFPQTEKSLLFMGGVGTGKTTLSVCVARELLDRSYSVLYFSAVSLFELLSRQRFSRSREEEPQDPTEALYDCDLLVIDDLGTELASAFSVEQLFSLINERMIRKKHLVISTNLGLHELQRVYAERVFSRVVSGFTVLKLSGDDIRLRKLLQ